MKKIVLVIIFLIGAKGFAQTELVGARDSFAPAFEKTYIISAWVKDDVAAQVTQYEGKVQITNTVAGSPVTLDIESSGPIIDGWQRIIGKFTLAADTEELRIELVSKSGGTSFFDDVRVMPYNGSLKSFVYDHTNLRLRAELDENNYATFYEYDNEGGLVRVKKETERGIFTIQETRSGNAKNEN